MTFSKKLIILEGIASTGKTTIEKLLAKKMGNYTLISEEETLMLLINNIDAQKALGHICQIINRAEQSHQRLVVIERLHFTHAFRTKSDLSVFSSIESQLKKNFSPLIVLLTIWEEKIEERIKEAREIRDTAWTKGKQGTLAEKVRYYKNQQEQLKFFATQTILPILQIDTSNKKWAKYVEEIAVKTEHKP